MKSNGRAEIQTEGSQNPKLMPIPHNMLPPGHRGLQLIEHFSPTLLSEMTGCLNEGEFSVPGQHRLPTQMSGRINELFSFVLTGFWLGKTEAA